MGRTDAGPVRTPVALPAASSAAVRGLLSSRPIRRMVLATAASSLGDWVGFLAIIALTADILGPTRAAAFAVSGVMAARVVPSLLLAPVAGVFVDRWDRKRVLIGTDVGRGIIMALIPFTQEILALVLATLVIEVLSALFAPAKDAVYPTLVRREQLVTANQLNLVMTYGMLPVAGVLYALTVSLAVRYAPVDSLLAARPIALPIWLNALSFLVSALLISSIRIRPNAAVANGTGSTIGADFREGLRFVAGHPVIRVLIGGVMVAAAGAGVVITIGEFFASLLNAGPSGFGVLVAAVGLGMVGGLLLAAPLTRRVRAEWLFAPAIIGSGTALVITALAPDLVAALVPAAAMGAGAGIVFIVGYTVLQQRADDRIRGRTFGAFNAGVRVAILGSTVLVPLAIGLIGRESRIVGSLDGEIAVYYPYVFGGIRLTLIGAGAITIVGGLLTFRVLASALRREAQVRAAHAAEHGTGSGSAPRDRASAAPAPRGVLIAFEGGDGSGKSTQIGLLRADLEARGFDVVVTREPGGTAIGERVRDILLDPRSSELSDRAETLLYAAARAQHVAEVIEPALAAGRVVLCDRFIDSSVVYQGAGRQLGEQHVEDLNLWATGLLVADLVVLLDVAVEEGLRRAGAEQEHDRLEAAGADFHARVRSAYRRRADAEPHRYLLLDANASVDEVHASIAADVTNVLAPIEAARVAPW
jgi:dTMP kinase